ncbi:MAG: hypothetical protein GTN62_05730, partial [Gemmatimonadales bacterium]|nr:hypothetical protein [Gemmatimonadales bacterium]NIP07060.1 hypothetical protein [Gemmatimonadales bacterium]
GYVSEKQLEHLRRELGEKAAILECCPVCRSRSRALELKSVYDATTKTR